MTRIRAQGKRVQAALARLERELPGALREASQKVAVVLGAQIARNVEGFKRYPPGTRRLARSFLVPHEAGLGRFILGLGAPVYAAIHEFGGKIVARNKRVRKLKDGSEREYEPMLTFMTPDGQWHSVKEVTIREKRYARDAVDVVQPKAPALMESVLIPLLRRRG